MSSGADIPPDWPNRAWSRRIRHRPHDWHVQVAGTGPLVLLLHGAGASTHSWRAVIPLLAESHRVVALDLPGQGFSRAGSRRRLGLSAMAEDIAALCAAQGWAPALIVGHSAGAAIALDLAHRVRGPDGTPPDIAGINAALSRFEGVAGWLFPVLAKLLALNPLTAPVFTLGPDKQARAKRLIESTGSRLDGQGLALYARLIGDRPHVEGTLQMMAQWQVERLLPGLPQIGSRCLLLTGSNDRAVPPTVSARVAETLPRAAHLMLDGPGHLAHEEAPGRVVRALRDPANWPA